mmetsp:Transcript_4286/g.12077  ORF Transcript_4286/g.12077 Transcript_4286/m.12077 type:complete len:202 (+) Transcript_4286:1517-2122(+)
MVPDLPVNAVLEHVPRVGDVHRLPRVHALAHGPLHGQVLRLQVLPPGGLGPEEPAQQLVRDGVHGEKRAPLAVEDLRPMPAECVNHLVHAVGLDPLDGVAAKVREGEQLLVRDVKPTIHVGGPHRVGRKAQKVVQSSGIHRREARRPAVVGLQAVLGPLRLLAVPVLAVPEYLVQRAGQHAPPVGVGVLRRVPGAELHELV